MKNDFVTAQIASMQERKDSLIQTVYSLINQVDHVFVALNKYDEVPEFLVEHPKISYKILDNSTGDAAKFYGIELMEGYVFTCDDDLIYPETYVKDMIAKIKEYDNKNIISLHGVQFGRKPISSYYKDPFSKKFRCLGEVKEDVFVHSGGTGVMAFHTDCIDLKYSDFEAPNMADVWMAKIAAEQGVNIVVVAHKEGYLKYIPQERTIYDDRVGSCELQTEITNKYIL